MERVLNVLIALVILALVGVGGYLGYTTFLVDDGTADDGIGPAARITEAGLVQLPLLRPPQLVEVLPTAADLPGNLSTAVADDPAAIDLNADQRLIGMTGEPSAASRFMQIRQAYAWTSASSVTFNTCTLNQNTSFVRAMVSQFPTTQQARDFIDDPLVRGYYRALGYKLAESEDLHGWTITSAAPIDGTCFAQEVEHLLFFDHLGLVVILQTNTNAAAASTAQATLASLAPRVMVNIHQLDAMAAITTVPPTPTPQSALATLLTANTRQDDLGYLMPSPRDWDLNANYTTDDAESQRFTLVEFVDFYRSIGTPETLALADAIDRAGRRYGLIAQHIRVWTPGEPCPPDEPSRIELDLALFERPAGADAYMRDTPLQGAWRGTSLLTEFFAVPDGVYAFGTVTNDCGPMQIVQKSVSYERLLFTLSMTLPASIERQAAQARIDSMLATTLSDLYLERLR